LAYRGASEVLDKDTIPWNRLKTKWIYVAPLSGLLCDNFFSIVDFAHENDIKIAANPSKHQLSLPIDTLQRIFIKTDVLFLWEEFDNKKSLDLINKKEGIDNLIYVDGAIVWNVDRKDYTKSGMNKFINSVLYKNMTARNVNTVRKICELMKNNER
jgi:hypothetical protein